MDDSDQSPEDQNSSRNGDSKGRHKRVQLGLNFYWKLGYGYFVLNVTHDLRLCGMLSLREEYLIQKRTFQGNSPLRMVYDTTC